MHVCLQACTHTRTRTRTQTQTYTHIKHIYRRYSVTIVKKWQNSHIFQRFTP
jgi:hypothetical protein